MAIPYNFDDDIVAWRGDKYKVFIPCDTQIDTTGRIKSAEYKPDSSRAGVKVQLSDGTQKWMSYIEYEEYRASNNK